MNKLYISSILMLALSSGFYVSAGWEQAKEKVKADVSTAGKKIKNKMDEAEKALTDISDDECRYGGTGHALKAKAEEAWTTTKEKTMNAWEQAKEGIYSGWKRIKGWFSGKAAEAKKAVTTAANKAKEEVEGY